MVLLLFSNISCVYKNTNAFFTHTSKDNAILYNKDNTNENVIAIKKCLLRIKLNTASTYVSSKHCISFVYSQKR